MVDILDMEDIFYDIIKENLPTNRKGVIRLVANKIKKEVSDFVEAQQTIACANCKGYKFKNIKSYNR